VSADGVEVSTYGVVEVAPAMDATGDRVVQAVHAVQRVGERTVVYWSMGYTGHPSYGGYDAFGRNPINVFRLEAAWAAPWVNVVVPEKDLFLHATVDPVQLDAASGSDGAARQAEPGTMVALYSVLAGLPEDVDTVDVTLGHAGLVLDVPVGEGLLEPVAEGPVVPLGTGWPEVDPRFLVPLENPVPSVRPLVTLTEALDGASREAQAAEQVTIDLAADVLFAFDSAELSPDARRRVQQLGTEVAGRAAPGQVSIVGHTDAEASDAYNDDLSRRRAQAVADVLSPILAPAGVTLVVEGRGEREPVADNATPEGRQLNRRVSVGFTEEAS
jgi:outer membrane protein OmpA-like peptidoglycan-associated protein